MTTAQRTLNFLGQQHIDIQAVCVEWHPVSGSRGEIRLKSFDGEGLDLPGDASIWLQVKDPFGIRKKCLGFYRNPNFDITLSLDENFVQDAKVKLYLTSKNADRQILATVHSSIPLVDAENRNLQNLLPRKKTADLGVGIPWKLDISKRDKIVLLVNQEWDQIMSNTEGDFFYSMVVHEIIRQIAVHVGEDSAIDEDIRDAWLRCFCETYSCTKPPERKDDEDNSDFQSAVSKWAYEVSCKIAEENNFKSLYESYVGRK